MRTWIWMTCSLLCMMQPLVGAAQNSSLKQESSSINIEFDSRQPGVSALSIDSLKKSEFRPSPIIDAGAESAQYKVSEHDGWVSYAPVYDLDHPVWQMRCKGDTITMRSNYRPNGASKEIRWKFDLDITHATLLGHTTPAGDIALPALLHLPGMGSLRVVASGNPNASLGFIGHRDQKPYVLITFPAATAEHPVVEYTLETAAIYPHVPGIKDDDPRYDGFRRGFIDILQMQAAFHVLANHSASDPCALVLYKYSDVARYMPELVKGLTALDLVRDTLDRYLAGFVSYGMPGYKEYDVPAASVVNAHELYPHATLDTYPSLLISAYDYADGSGDTVWLKNNYKGLRKWADEMTAPNTDGSPLLEYPASGNSGSWTEKWTVRPANWWDTVGFGHQDAYSNALGYRALRSMAVLADRVGETADAARYRKRADAIHDAYVSTFLDRSAGVLAGWKSTDGELHNYYFPFVNGIAVRYGLIDGDKAHLVMDNILKKMDSVGYKDFSLGLPGNLIPIKGEDYPEHDPRYGSPTPDGSSDGFQIYENGGATACHSYFTIAALYYLGETEKGDKILMAELDALSKQKFSGRAPGGLTYDWKDWKGEAHGYEGFLVDNYYTYLAVLDRAHMLVKMP